MPHEAFTEEEYSGKMKLRTWGDLLRHARAYKWHLVGLVALCAMTAACDNLFPLVHRQLIDGVVAHNNDPATPVPFVLYGLEYAGLILGLCASIFGFIVLGGRISTGLSHDIRRSAFRRLQELSFSYYDKRPVGWLVARLTSDCDRLSRIIAWGCLDVLMSFWTLAVAATILFWLNWQLALVVLVIVVPMAFVSIYFKQKLLGTSREVRKTNSKITAAYSEGIAGVRTTKSLVREEENLHEFRGLTSHMYDASVRNAILGAMYLPIIMTLGNVSLALGLWAGGVKFTLGAISIGTLVLFISYSQHFVWPIAEMARVFTDMQAAQAAAERVLGLLATEPEIRDAPEVEESLRRSLVAPPEPGFAPDGYPQRIAEIEFRDVSFEYLPGQPVLEHFSLRVNAGETIALVGPTGGGKSTIVALVCRFYEPTGGEIRIGGIDYRRRSLAWLQSNLGIVLQTPHLFAGTIRENIRYGRLSASDDEVEQVARMVGAHAFISAMEKAYESEVGEGGSRLSTGQKQLIALARAVLADPQIFIMDEATSSVDTETEQIIHRGVEQVLRNRTSFVIAHRLSTIRSADRILVVDGGRIVEEGNHHDLIVRRGRYYELYTNQFTQEREEAVLRGTA